MASNAAHATDAGCNKCKKCEKSEKYEKCDNFVTSVKSVKIMKSIKSVTISEICGMRRQRYVYIHSALTTQGMQCWARLAHLGAGCRGNIFSRNKYN